MDKDIVEEGSERIEDVYKFIESTGAYYVGFSFLSDGENVFILSNADAFNLITIIDYFKQTVDAAEFAVLKKLVLSLFEETDAQGEGQRSDPVERREH